MAGGDRARSADESVISVLVTIRELNARKREVVAAKTA